MHAIFDQRGDVVSRCNRHLLICGAAQVQEKLVTRSTQTDFMAVAHPTHLTRQFAHGLDPSRIIKRAVQSLRRAHAWLNVRMDLYDLWHLFFDAVLQRAGSRMRLPECPTIGHLDMQIHRVLASDLVSIELMD